jgi:Tfp pilus assembly protein PilF
MEPVERAIELWHRGTSLLIGGHLDDAVVLFTRSLRVHPTAEAYTFRGWAYSLAGRLEEAIEECRKAIATDPGFGNPYNDIGCYLMQQGKLDEAVSWLEQAKRAARYEPRHFPYLNLGRLRAARGEYAEAVAEFKGALEFSPGDALALKYLEALKRHVN